MEKLLRNFGLEMEMASGNYVLAMTSFMDRQEGFERLAKALQEIDRELSFSDMLEEAEEKAVITPQEIYRKPEKAMEIYEAWEAACEALPLEEAVGGIAGDAVFLYPPGIPVLVPGERIDRAMVENLRRCLALGLDVEGLDGNECISIVKNA